MEYGAAWKLQQALVLARRHDSIPDVLLLLQHPHTYTLGRRGKQENILLDAEGLRERGIAVHSVDRGGDVTYHGPGQVVGYPILKLGAERPNYVRYIRDVEHAMLAAVRDLGAPGELSDGFSGVWIGNQKVCAIGVKVDAFGVTSHGVALNVNVDLSYFEHIIPCGLVHKGVTSLREFAGRRQSMDRAMRAVSDNVARTFKLSPRGIAPNRLDALLSRRDQTLLSA